jgi:type I restriction enzyme, S subunit
MEKSLRDLELLVPPKDIVSKFDEIVQLVFEMRSLANQANQSLSDLRDSLLPKLMSGKIRIQT